MSAKAPRKKIRWDLWMIVTVGVSIFYMLSRGTPKSRGCT